MVRAREDVRIDGVDVTAVVDDPVAGLCTLVAAHFR
jgi:hypothetical protein